MWLLSFVGFLGHVTLSFLSQVKIQVSKEALGGIPLWIIIVSILIGLLILALVIFALWKVCGCSRPSVCLCQSGRDNVAQACIIEWFNMCGLVCNTLSNPFILKSNFRLELNCVFFFAPFSRLDFSKENPWRTWRRRTWRINPSTTL